MINNIYTWILFILCGILVVCFVHRFYGDNNNKVEEFQSSADALANGDIMKKRILSLFTGKRPGNGVVQFTTLIVQTRPWQNKDKDAIISIPPPFTEQEMQFPDTIKQNSDMKQKAYDILRKKPSNRVNDFFSEGLIEFIKLCPIHVKPLIEEL